jgi:hypothetical protein
MGTGAYYAGYFDGPVKLNGGPLTVIYKENEANIPSGYIASITNAKNTTGRYGLIVGTNWASNENFVANFGNYNALPGQGEFTSYLAIKGDGNVGIGTEDPGADKLDVRGRAYASGGWQTTNADYAEWFEKEEDTVPGDIIGINLVTGKARKYRPGDKFIGIQASNPGVVGNRIKETDEEMTKTHILVSLLGQVDFDRSQVEINGRIVRTKDGKEIGILLSNGKVLIGK